MRTLSSIVATLLIGTPPAMAQSKWLESGHLDPSEVSALCERASDVRVLARTQMTTTGNERWRRLSRQELVVEAYLGQASLGFGAVLRRGATRVRRGE